MANKPLKTLTFPGLDDTYTIPQTAEDLPISSENDTTIAEELSQLSAEKVDSTDTITNAQIDALFN